MNAPLEIHRLLPSADEAEKGLISSLLLAPPQVAALLHSRGITPGHLHLPALSEILFECLAMLAEGKPLDGIVICQRLRDRDKLEAVGGAPAVFELFTFLPTAANASYYIEQVEEKHRLREIIRICTEHAAWAYEEQDEVEFILDSLHAQVTAICQRKSTRPNIKSTIGSILKEITSGAPDGTLLDTGMEGVDGRLSLYRGDLLLISAPTSCGKSALAFQLGLSVAMRGRRVAFYPLEMRQKQSIKRGIAQLSGYNAEFVRKLALSAVGGTIHQQEASAKAQNAFVAAAQSILAMKLHMRDDLHRLEAILADIRAESSRQPFDFIVIDYLQLIQVSDKFERRQLQIAAITQRLKALANEMDCVICVPSQVNKEGGTREAQDAENDASALIKIHAEQDKSGDITPGRVEVWKQREGKRHIDLPLVFNDVLTRFEYKTKATP